MNDFKIIGLFILGTFSKLSQTVFVVPEKGSSLLQNLDIPDNYNFFYWHTLSTLRTKMETVLKILFDTSLQQPHQMQLLEENVEQKNITEELILLANNLLESNTLPSKRLIAAFLLAAEIWQNKESNDEIIIVAEGIHGSQIAHLASHFLAVKTKMIDPLSLTWLILEPLIPELGLSATATKALIASIIGAANITRELIHQRELYKKQLVELCKKKVGYNPIHLDKLRELLQLIFQTKMRQNPKNISKLITVGSTFTEMSMLPNLSIINRYYNIYSLRDESVYNAPRLDLNKIYRKSFVNKNYSLTKEMLKKNTKNEEGIPFAKVVNIEVVYEALASCSCNDFKIKSPVHNELLNLPMILSLIKNIYSTNTNFPSEVQAINKASLSENLLIVEQSPQSLDFKLRKISNKMKIWYHSYDGTEID